MPARVIATMPRRMALPTRRTIRTAMRASPAAARSTCGSETLPSPTRSSGIGDDDVCVAQTDEGDEKADACSGAVLEAIGDAVHDLFADVGEGEEQKEQAGEKDNTESGLPGDAAAKDDGVGEVGVEEHARSEGDGIVGPQPHDQGGDHRRNARGEENSFDGHASFREDARVDDDYVGHGHEGGESSAAR